MCILTSEKCLFAFFLFLAGPIVSPVSGGLSFHEGYLSSGLITGTLPELLGESEMSINKAFTLLIVMTISLVSVIRVEIRQETALMGNERK